jgi:hypothetical protein
MHASCAVGAQKATWQRTPRESDRLLEVEKVELAALFRLRCSYLPSIESTGNPARTLL